MTVDCWNCGAAYEFEGRPTLPVCAGCGVGLSRLFRERPRRAGRKRMAEGSRLAVDVFRERKAREKEETRMAEETLQEKVERLERENAALAAENAAQAPTPRGMGPLTFKVGNKGGVSIYGLGQRFPITMYPDQAEYLLDHAQEVRDFIAANERQLKRK